MRLHTLAGWPSPALGTEKSQPPRAPGGPIHWQGVLHHERPGTAPPASQGIEARQLRQGWILALAKRRALGPSQRALPPYRPAAQPKGYQPPARCHKGGSEALMTAMGLTRRVQGWPQGELKDVIAAVGSSIRDRAPGTWQGEISWRGTRPADR